MSAILRRADTYRAFEIRPNEGNYFACIVDPVADGSHGIDFTAIVEIEIRRQKCEQRIELVICGRGGN